MSTSNTVVAKVVTVLKEVCGFAKDKDNKFQGYKYQSIDAFFNELHEPLAKAGIVVYPRIVRKDLTFLEGTNKSGESVRTVHCAVDCEYVFTDGESEFVAVAPGEGADNGDKATNKAMTGSFKTALKMVFMVGTKDGQDDSEADSPELPKKVKTEKKPEDAAKNEATFIALRDIIREQGGQDLFGFAVAALAAAGLPTDIPAGAKPDNFLLKTLLIQQGVKIDAKNNISGLTPEAERAVGKFLATFNEPGKSAA